MYQNFIALNNYNLVNIPEYSTTTSYTEDAEDLFVDAKEKLLDVNNWKRYSGMTGIDFRLTDGHTRSVNRKAHRGDHIKISVSGQEAKDYCVRIDAIEYDDYPDLGMEAFTIRVHPCDNFLNKNDEDNDHEDAEGTLIIERRGKKVFASFNSRNEAINADNNINSNMIDGWFGLSDGQWNSLVKGFVD